MLALHEQRVVWEPQPGPQTELLTCPVFEILFGGARGGGKTDGVLGEWISHADLYAEHAIGLMVRRSLVELVETIERSKALYLPLGADYHQQDKMWRFPNGARLRFAYLERDSDAESYQGHSYTRLYIEEIGNFPRAAPILKLMATLRSGAGVPVGVRATGNPGGPGQQWVRDRYIDPAPGGWTVLRDDTTGLERIYIPSRVADNRYLDQAYINLLKASGSPQLVRAWLEGDWSAVEGAFFQEWSSDRHVIDPAALPSDWTCFRSVDWGSAAPFSVGWWTVVGDEWPHPSGTILPRGALIRYREWYGAHADRSGLKYTAEEVARGIIERSGEERYAYTVVDPSMFAQSGGPSIAERMMKQEPEHLLLGLRPGDNKRISKLGALGGWDQMRARLKGDGERPAIYVFSTCLASIRTIPVLQHDKINAEDLDTEGEDHAADEWRYACMSRPYVAMQRVVKQKPRTLTYAADDSGRIIANMNVMDIVQERIRRRKAEED